MAAFRPAGAPVKMPAMHVGGMSAAVVALRRARTAARAVAAQARTPAPPAPAQLDLAPCAAGLERAGARVAHLRLAARREPWTPTGLRAPRGAAVTWLAHGDSWLFGRRGPHFDAAMQLRGRAGGAAPAWQGTGATHTALAPHDGPVELCCLLPAELHGADERIVYDRVPRMLCGGGFDVVTAVWPPGADVVAGLRSAAAADPSGLCAREADRLARPLVPPAGWHPHPTLPLGGIHTALGDEIAADAQGRVEIIRREARAPLTPTLSLRWRWRLDRLPSALAEDTLLTHDYLSVAVEFDDGTDLTYYWSSTLPPGTSYRCPLPHWRHREWHVVARSGTDGLGTWQQEERLIAPDRDRAIGGPAPREVVRVWLIATTLMQRERGCATWADIELSDGARTVRVTGA